MIEKHNLLQYLLVSTGDYFKYLKANALEDIFLLETDYIVPEKTNEMKKIFVHLQNIFFFVISILCVV